MIKKIGLGLCTLTILGSLLSGCGGKSPVADPANNMLNEPVTLVVKSDFADDQAKFDSSYGDKIKAKFPNVTIKFIPRAEVASMKDLLASGITPDIMYGNITNIDTNLISTGLAFDISDLIKKNSYDINRFEPTLIDQVKATNPNGALYGLPMPYGGTFVTFYNKALFDKFGVPYPKDGMTWDDVYTLAKKMTRSEAGQDYRGFASFIGALLRDNQLSVPYLDPKSDTMGDTEKWKKLIDDLGRFYFIPNNNRDPKKKSQTEEAGAFAKNMNIAMQVNQFGVYQSFPDELNWDMVTMPTFKEAPNVGTQIGSNYWFITNTNKSKDISFQVITYLLSDEVQMASAKETASIPSLKTTSSVFKYVGQDVPQLKGKNIEALYKNKPAPAPAARDKKLIGADPIKLKTTLENAFNRYTLDNIDINTVLREAAEAILKLVEEKKNS